MCVCMCLGRDTESDVDNWTPPGLMRGHTFGMNKEKCSKLKQNIHLNLLPIQRIKR